MNQTLIFWVPAVDFAGVVLLLMAEIRREFSTRDGAEIRTVNHGTNYQPQLSNEENLGWLFDIGDEILPSYMFFFINHEIRTPIKQAV